MTDKNESSGGTAVADPVQNGAAQAAAQVPQQAVPQQALPATRPAGAAGTVRMGLAPTTIEEGWRMAQIIAQTDLVPKGYRGKPADVLAAIQYGMEVGLPPMAALHSIYVTNGRPALFGEGLMGVIMSSPLYKDHEEYYLVAGKQVDVLSPSDLKNDDTTAVTRFWRKDTPRPRVGSFSIAQAKKANLFSKEGPWQQYPDRMLKMRARSFAARDAFPDLLRGIKTVEEVQDLPPDENVIDTQAIEPRRLSEAPKSETAPSTAATAAAPAPVRRQIRGLLITATSFVRPKGIEPYYEVTAETTTRQLCSFITRDEQVYKDAAALEGTAQAVVLTVHTEPHPAPTATVKEFAVIDAIANDDPAATDLFTQP